MYEENDECMGNRIIQWQKKPQNMWLQDCVPNHLTCFRSMHIFYLFSIRMNVLDWTESKFLIAKAVHATLNQQSVSI